MEAIKTDYRQAALDPQDRAILDFTAKLTRDPGSMTEEDVVGLREAGLDDTAIHDVVQVTALFNYYNRLADGLGVSLEED